MSKERLEEIIEKVKRSDEYAEKGLWEASDGIIIHLHNEGYINYLIERVQELEEENKVMFTTLSKLSNRDTYSMIDGQMKGQAIDTIKQILRLRRNRHE